MTEIRNYSDFVSELLRCGFSTAGSDKGIFSVLPFTWENQDESSPIRWHTGDPDTDPWQWRMRVLEERDDIAYAKLFFRASGYISKEWYPYFYGARRQGMDFEDAYESGVFSRAAKQIYEIVSEHGDVAVHDVKRLGGFRREDNAAFDRAILELQTGMFLTVSGQAQKLNRWGMPYGWHSSVLSTAEHFWAVRGLTLGTPDPEACFEKIRERILLLNPAAAENNIRKFIEGST